MLDFRLVNKMLSVNSPSLASFKKIMHYCCRLHSLYSDEMYPDENIPEQTIIPDLLFVYFIGMNKGRKRPQKFNIFSMCKGAIIIINVRRDACSRGWVGVKRSFN